MRVPPRLYHLFCQRACRYVILSALSIWSLFALWENAVEYAKYEPEADYLHDKHFALHPDTVLGPQAALPLPAVHRPPPSDNPLQNKDPTSYLHLLVSGTGPDVNLCKLLLSSTALGYPSPSFIGFDAPSEASERGQLEKNAGEIVAYLRTLQAAQQDDLVLLVDGSSVLFQLPPGVLISRYYDVILSENLRLLNRSREGILDPHAIYPSIVFAPDKGCFPEGAQRPACWAVPDSPLPPYAFGPDTDSGDQWPEHNTPRWLSSGTVMGPARDLRRLFDEVLDRLAANDAGSTYEQECLADIFGAQEVTRRKFLKTIQPPRLANGSTFEELGIAVSPSETGEDYEFHITLDYESKMFQSLAFYWMYVGWITHNGGSAEKLSETNEASKAETLGKEENQLYLPPDILNSPPPLSGFKTGASLHGGGPDPSRDPHPIGLDIPPALNWRDMLLGTNTITRQVFAIINFTPPMELTEMWWDKFWFFPYGEAIVRNATPATGRLLLTSKDGRRWFGWDRRSEGDEEAEKRTVGGFTGPEWRSWDALCTVHEGVVFRNERPSDIAF